MIEQNKSCYQLVTDYKHHEKPSWFPSENPVCKPVSQKKKIRDTPTQKTSQKPDDAEGFFTPKGHIKCFQNSCISCCSTWQASSFCATLIKYTIIKQDYSLKKTKNVVFEKTKTFSEKDTQEQVAHLDSYQFCSLKFLHGSYYQPLHSLTTFLDKPIPDQPITGQQLSLFKYIDVFRGEWPAPYSQGGNSN